MIVQVAVSYIKNNQFLSYWFYRIKDLLKTPNKKISNEKLDDYWKDRIQDVCDSSDNNKIEMVENAGTLHNGYQIMHNGLKIFIGSYYGTGTAMFGMHEMLRLNKGVHEPQEEYVFQEVLKLLPANSVMLELGSYWAFYSMWFNKIIPNAKNYMIEPDARCLYSGKRNFEINGLKGSFFQFLIGKDSSKIDTKKQICVDDFLKQQNIKHLNILHSDIQGFELEMLLGARNTLQNKKVDFVFISTHTDDLHENCKNKLIEYGYYIVAEANMQETFSFDGLLVASVNRIAPFSISKK